MAASEDAAPSSDGGAPFPPDLDTQEVAVTEAYHDSPRPDTDVVVLQVGDRQFTTTISTLTTGTSYFDYLRFAPASPNDKPHFIDADPAVFQHILNYQRRGTLPILWTGKDGFDFGVYAAILRDAKHFEVRHLASWIENEEYLEAVKTTYSVQVFEGCPLPTNITSTANIDKTYHVSWPMINEYRCPRDIPVHHGRPDQCGRACEKAKHPDVSYYVDVVRMRTVVVGKSTRLSSEFRI